MIWDEKVISEMEKSSQRYGETSKLSYGTYLENLRLQKEDASHGNDAW
jgi:hypothetical protein